MSIKTYKVTMLGPSGIGKTSLLSAIYDQFEQVAGRLQITIAPESETLLQIQECLTQLKSLTEANNDVAVRPGQGVRGTIEPFAFYFDLGVKGKAPSLRLHFQDYPGGWLESHPDEMNKVINFLQESVAVLIPIDATALMEKEGKYHELMNLETTVNTLIRKAYGNIDSPRLVILAPVKCEKYMKDGKVRTLLQRVDEKYEKLIEFFKAPNLRSKIAVVKMPVQTVGNVIFYKLDDTNKREPIFYFRRTKANAVYAPKNSEQIIKYLLKFILKLHLERNNKLVKFFRNLLKLDKPFQIAATQFAREPEQEDCKILQGNSWLDV